MSKKKKDTSLVFLILLKWFAELIYFVGIVFVAGTALLLLTYNILNIPLNYIHIAALIASFIYILVGFFVANSSEDIVIASNYFKILSALGYLAVISYFDNQFFDYLKNPVIGICLALPFLIAIIYKRFYRKMIYRAVFKKHHSVSFYSEYSSIEKIKASMLDTVRKAVKDGHKENVEVVGKSFRQDAKGNIIGIFKISLIRKLFTITHPKLMLITLNFNINNNE